jgi:hypothetical protein
VKGSGSIRLGESSGVVLGIRAERKRGWAEGRCKRPITIVAEITAANLTSLAAKGSSGRGRLRQLPDETGALPDANGEGAARPLHRPSNICTLGDRFGKPF